MTTRLDCSVTNCIYNDEKYCSKGGIHVEGSSAVNPQDTCCGSFVERKEGCGCNSVGEPSENIEVGCDARNCVYNEREKCMANHIGISGSKANRATDTECASFSCK